MSKYGLNVQVSSRVEKAEWNDQERVWTVRVKWRSETETMTAHHVVLATGAGGQLPKMPALPGREMFHGEVLHSVDYRTSAHWKGKKGVIIGTANTAHDVAEDMLDAGLDSVTMVQRSPTPVLPHSYYRHATDPIYNDKLPTDLADRMWFGSTPAPVTRLLILQNMKHAASQDGEYFDALDRVGFRNESVCDLSHILYERLGSHYLDIGASAKVAQGLIKMKSDAALKGFEEHGLTFSDGSTLEADVVVFATGFEGNMRIVAAQFLDEEVVEKMDDFYQFDAEGEVIGAWRPQQQPNIWYAGADLGAARFFSRFLALQIKADLAGEPLKPYLKHKP